MQRKNFAATGSFVAEDRPRALDLLGFASQLVFNTFHNRRLHDWEHGGDLELAYGAARAHNRGMVEFCSVDHRLLPTLLRAAGRHRPGRGAWPTRPSRWAPPRCWSPSGCPPGHSPSHVGLDPVWARGAGGRHPGRVPRRRHRRPDRPELLPQRPADPARLPRRRGELPLGRLHGHPRPAGADAGHDDLRRRVRALPRPARRRHRAGRHLGAVVDAPDGVGVRRLRPPRGAPPGPVAAAERVRAPPDAVHAVPHRGRRLDHRAGRPRGRACSRPTTPTSRAAAGPIERFEAVAGRRRRRRPPGLLPRQLPRPDGLGPPAAA